MEKVNDVEIDEKIMQYIKEFGDCRVCTYCGGPLIIPLKLKMPKESDVWTTVGDNILYISSYMYRMGLKRITKDAIDDRLCLLNGKKSD